MVYTLCYIVWEPNMNININININIYIIGLISRPYKNPAVRPEAGGNPYKI